MKISATITYVLTCCVLTGCWATRADLEAQGLRLQTLEAGLDEERKQLEQVLNDASSVIRRNSADQGQQIEVLQKRFDAVEGKLAEVRHESKATTEVQVKASEAMAARFDEIALAAGMDVPLPAAEIPKKRERHFAAAMKALSQSDHAKARALFRRYIERFPTDMLADDAQHGIGVAYLRQGKSAAALGEFKKVLSTYRKGDVVDQTLYDMADAFYTLRSCADAKKALEALLKGHKKSPLIKDAKKRVTTISASGAAFCDQDD